MIQPYGPGHFACAINILDVVSIAITYKLQSYRMEVFKPNITIMMRDLVWENRAYIHNIQVTHITLHM